MQCPRLAAHGSVIHAPDSLPLGGVPCGRRAAARTCTLGAVQLHLATWPEAAEEGDGVWTPMPPAPRDDGSSLTADGRPVRVSVPHELVARLNETYPAVRVDGHHHGDRSSPTFDDSTVAQGWGGGVPDRRGRRHMGAPAPRGRAAHPHAGGETRHGREQDVYPDRGSGRVASPWHWRYTIRVPQIAAAVDLSQGAPVVA